MAENEEELKSLLMKRHLFIGRKYFTNLDSALKIRNITLLTKVLIVKATVFSVVMYRCESWTIKKPEHWRTDDLELWYWRRLLRVLGLQEDQTLVNSEGNQLWIFTRKTNALALAKPPVLWPPDVKSWLLRGRKKKQKKLMLVKVEGRRRRGWQRIRWLDCITGSMDMSLNELQEMWRTGKPVVLQSMGSQWVRHDWVTE